MRACVHVPHSARLSKAVMIHLACRCQTQERAPSGGSFAPTFANSGKSERSPGGRRGESHDVSFLRPSPENGEGRPPGVAPELSKGGEPFILADPKLPSNTCVARPMASPSSAMSPRDVADDNSPVGCVNGRCTCHHACRSICAIRVLLSCILMREQTSMIRQ